MKIIDINGRKRDCTKIYPDPNYAGFMKAEFASKRRKGYVHCEWFPIPEFLNVNPNLSDLIENAPQLPGDDLGRVRTATAMTLSDESKNWKENEYLGFPVWISRGKGEGQTRTVIKNEANKLFLDQPWKIIPNETSQYVLSYNIHDPQIRGNTLPPLEKDSKLTKKIKSSKN